MYILVSNLSVNVIVDDLTALFAVYGNVSYATIIRDKESGRSKGNAFLEMPQAAQAEQAILALNNKLVDGKAIAVQQIGYTAGEFNN